jgi:hypothetical protein
MKTYWHFARTNDEGVPVLGYGDGREIRVGETLTVDVHLVLCEAGLHASENILDALNYAGGNVICEVTLGGVIVVGDDKVTAQERTVVRMLDAATGEKVLRQFARWCALSVAHLWEMPEVVRRYLETGDESIRDAAWAAARAAAWDVAGAAAWAAAGAAAWAAAGAAAWDAAWAAAGAAAWDAARAAAGAAARAAAWDAARAAAGAAARAAAGPTVALLQASAQDLVRSMCEVRDAD